MRVKNLVVYVLILILSSCSEASEEKKIEIDQEVPIGMAWIAKASFDMGLDSRDALPAESPKHRVTVDGFFIDRYEVTNRQFRAFVKATNYVTTAEIKPTWEGIKNQFPIGTDPLPDSVLVAGSIVYFKTNNTNLTDYRQWWQYIEGACWKNPLGPKSTIDSLLNHPVVHVSWHDAKAYAKWIKKDLPTEAEWELAAGAAKGYIYPWGNSVPNNTKPQSNHYQGSFPVHNDGIDGFIRTSPIGSFPANINGLYDMGGNTWEWCEDWYSSNYFSNCKKEGVALNPMGPKTYHDPLDSLIEKKVVKGGSFLCNDAYCSGYKIARKMQTDPYSSLDHTGFRCVVRPYKQR